MDDVTLTSTTSDQPPSTRAGGGAAFEVPPPLSAALMSPTLREMLRRSISRFVPEHDVEEIAQATIADALRSTSTPTEPSALRIWILHVARSQALDYDLRTRRERLESLGDEGPSEATESPIRWAERELPPSPGAQETLNWLLLEAAGATLEAIAAAENVSADVVRQRVLVMREHFRARRVAEDRRLAALGVL